MSNTRLIAHQRKTHQSDPDPDQLAEAPQQREGNSGDIGIAESLEQQQIAAVLRTQTAGDEERPAFDEDGEGPDRDRRPHIGRPSEIVDDDEHFQRLSQPPQEIQTSGRLERRLMSGIEIQNRLIKRPQLVFSCFEKADPHTELPQRLQGPGKEAAPLHEHKRHGPEGQ